METTIKGITVTCTVWTARQEVWQREIEAQEIAQLKVRVSIGMYLGTEVGFEIEQGLTEPRVLEQPGSELGNELELSLWLQDFAIAAVISSPTAGATIWINQLGDVVGSLPNEVRDRLYTLWNSLKKKLTELTTAEVVGEAENGPANISEAA